VICLGKDSTGFTVCDGHLGIFFLDDKSQICNRYSLVTPKPIIDFLK
jgi:hypothetical protein